MTNNGTNASSLAHASESIPLNLSNILDVYNQYVQKAEQIGHQIYEGITKRKSHLFSTYYTDSEIHKLITEWQEHFSFDPLDEQLDFSKVFSKLTDTEMETEAYIANDQVVIQGMQLTEDGCKTRYMCFSTHLLTLEGESLDKAIEGVIEAEEERLYAILQSENKLHRLDDVITSEMEEKIRELVTIYGKESILKVLDRIEKSY